MQKKKKDAARRRMEEIESNYTNKNIKDFYLGIRRVKEGFKSKLCICTNKECKIITNEKQVIERWTEYFQKLLNQKEKTSRNNEKENNKYTKHTMKQMTMRPKLNISGGSCSNKKAKERESLTS